MGDEFPTADVRPPFLRAEEQLADLIDSLGGGERLPSEPELARQFGVSRATLREALRLFEERGRIARKPHVGTMVLDTHPVIETGLEVLESLDTLAQRLNLPTRMANPVVAERGSDPTDCDALDIPPGSPVTTISRTIYTGEAPIAFLVDVLPSGIVSPAELENFKGSVLDLLLKRNNPPLDRSYTEIAAISASDSLARRLGIHRGTPLIHLEAVLYAQDGRAVDHSHSYFVPGYFKFHVLRKIG